MSFPVVQTTSNGSVNLNTSHSITLPSGIIAGDKLIVFFATDGSSNGDTDTPAGWTKDFERVEDSGADAVRLVMYSKIAAGSDTLTITTTGGVDSAYTCYRIVSDNDIEAGTAVDGNDTNPNPPSLTPTGGSQEYLWLAATAFQSGTVSAYPTNYDDNQITNADESFKIASATYSNEASVQDPGTFTTTTGRWVANTVSLEAQSVATGSFAVIVGGSTIFQPAIDYATDASFVLITQTSEIFAPVAKASNQTIWTNENSPSTTWTNEERT